MSLEKIIVVDLVEVLENKIVQVRTKTAIVEDGNQISGTFHRHAICPGDDYSAEADNVKAICAVMHTPEVVAQYKAAQEAAQLPA
jgi:hypothetical protein